MSLESWHAILVITRTAASSESKSNPELKEEKNALISSELSLSKFV